MGQDIIYKEISWLPGCWEVPQSDWAMWAGTGTGWQCQPGTQPARLSGRKGDQQHWPAKGTRVLTTCQESKSCSWATAQGHGTGVGRQERQKWLLTARRAVVITGNRRTEELLQQKRKVWSSLMATTGTSTAHPSVDTEILIWQFCN